MERTFEFTIENADELQAVDVIIHSTDGSYEIHRLYEADEPKMIVVDGGGMEQ